MTTNATPARPVRTVTPAVAKTAEHLLDQYVRGAVDIRWDDLEAFIAEVADDPDGIVDEVIASAEDRGVELTPALHTELVAEAEAFTRTARRRVWAEQARQAGEQAVAAARAELDERDRA